MQSRYRGYKDRKETQVRLEAKKRMNAMEEQQMYESELQKKVDARKAEKNNSKTEETRKVEDVQQGKKAIIMMTKVMM